MQNIHQLFDSSELELLLWCSKYAANMAWIFSTAAFTSWLELLSELEVEDEPLVPAPPLPPPGLRRPVSLVSVFKGEEEGEEGSAEKKIIKEFSNILVFSHAQCRHGAIWKFWQNSTDFISRWIKRQSFIFSRETTRLRWIFVITLAICVAWSWWFVQTQSLSPLSSFGK